MLCRINAIGVVVMYLWIAWGTILLGTRRAKLRPLNRADLADLRAKTDRPEFRGQYI